MLRIGNIEEAGFELTTETTQSFGSPNPGKPQNEFEGIGPNGRDLDGLETISIFNFFVLYLAF